MGDKSKIEWCDASWTPLRAKNPKTGKTGWHCELASPGCEHCYSQAQNRRYGTGLSFVRRSRDEAGLLLDEKMLGAPLRWRKPKKIFVCANTDLFGEWVPDEWIDRIFAVMALAPQHTFQVLTKRAKRMREYLAADPDYVVEPSPDRTLAIIRGMEPIVGIGAPFAGRRLTSHLGGQSRLLPLPNVWMGISAEDQQRLDERVPELLKTPAAVRFVSAEPLLSGLDFSFHFGRNYDDLRGLLSWVIVGGESGPGARQMKIAWARDIVRQCREAGVSCFVKQDSGPRPGEQGRLADDLWTVKEFPDRRLRMDLARR